MIGYPLIEMSYYYFLTKRFQKKFTEQINVTSASHIDFNLSVSQGLLPLTLGTFLQYYFALLEPYRFSGSDRVNNTFISMSFFTSPLLILYNLSVL